VFSKLPHTIAYPAKEDGVLGWKEAPLAARVRLCVPAWCMVCSCVCVCEMHLKIAHTQIRWTSSLSRHGGLVQ